MSGWVRTPGREPKDSLDLEFCTAREWEEAVLQVLGSGCEYRHDRTRDGTDFSESLVVGDSVLCRKVSLGNSLLHLRDKVIFARDPVGDAQEALRRFERKAK